MFIIFALNPDGMRYDLTGTPYRAWRKNRQRDTAGNAMYTDLNRNYGYRWGCCRGSSGKRSSSMYRGPSAFSAPETRALRDFVNGRVVGGVQQIRTHVTLHTNGQLILWPYGYTKTNIPADMTALDHAALVSLGRAMAAQNGYVAKQSSDLYVTDGDQIDWMYGKHRIFSYTFELFPAETSTVWGDHYPDNSFIAGQTQRNRKALLHLVDRAGCPYADLGSGSTAANCGLLFDDLEINRGWVRNAAGTDTATSGRWAVGNPQVDVVGRGEATREDGLRGPRPGDRGGRRLLRRRERPVDGGTTTIRSRVIRLPADPAAYGYLTFRWVLAHSASSSVKDALRVLVEAEDGTQTVVFEVLGRPVNVNGSWRSARVSLAAWAGQAIRLVVAAADGANASLVEAAVDDIRIRTR